MLSLHIGGSWLIYRSVSILDAAMAAPILDATMAVPEPGEMSAEERSLKDLSVILRSNVFPGSSHASDEWCPVVKSVYLDHQISPENEVGIYMRPKKDYRRKVGWKSPRF